MTIHKKGQAHWEIRYQNEVKALSTESGVLNQQIVWILNTPVRRRAGNQPEEHYAAVCGLFHGAITHAGRGWIYADIH